MNSILKGRKSVSWKTLLLLAAMILLTAVFSMSDYVSGHRIMAFNQDIGSDSLHLYAAQYASIVRHLKEGTFTFWDASNAYGADVNIYSLGNPFLWIVYLTGIFAGTAAMFRSLVFVYILQILLAGIFVYLFLSLFRFGEVPKLAASYLYAFSGFMMVWGQHYAFASYPVHLALLVLAAERALRDRRKWKAVAAAAFLTTASSVYGAYMIFLFAGGYVVVRALMTVRKDDLRGTCGRALRCVLSMFLGIAMGAVILLPGAMQIVGTTKRLTYETSALERVFSARFPAGYYKVLAWRFFSPSVQGINYEEYPFGNYYEAPVTGFSILFLFLAAQYVFLIPKMKKSLRGKAVRYAAAAFMLYGLLLPHVSVVMNGFAYAFTRYQFLYALYFAVISAETLHEIFEEGRGNAVLAGITGAAVLAVLVRLFLSRRGTTGELFALLFAVTAAFTLFLVFSMLPRGRGKRLPVIALLIVLMANITGDMIFTYDNGGNHSAALTRGAVREGDGVLESLYDPDTAAAIRLLEEDDTFFRIEKLSYTLMGTDPLVQGYAGVSGYNSMRSTEIDTYMLRYWKDLWQWHTAHFYYPHGAQHRDQAQLAGIRYLLAREGDVPPDGYVLRETVGKVRIYEDPEVTCAASFYTDHEGERFAYGKRDKDAQIVMRRGKNDSRLGAFVRTEKEGILFLGVAYQKGWRVYLDGKETVPLKLMEGFTGVAVPAGEHEVTLRYMSPGFPEGCAVSAAAWMLYFALAFLGRKRRRHADHTV